MMMLEYLYNDLIPAVVKLVNRILNDILKAFNRHDITSFDNSCSKCFNIFEHIAFYFSFKNCPKIFDRVKFGRIGRKAQMLFPQADFLWLV